MIRATDEANIVDLYINESRERFDRIESLASDIVRILRADDKEGLSP